MASDKGKGVAAVTRKTRQTQANKATLKQKTLLDSFFVRTASKNAVFDTLPSAEIQESEPIVQDEASSDASNVPLHENLEDTEDVIIANDFTEPPLGIPLPIPKPSPSENTGTSEDNGPIIIVDSSPRRTRSPSIVIIESELVVPPRNTTTRRSTSKRQTTPEGRTSDKAIVVESSPIKAPSKPAKPIHPFFGSRAKVSKPSIPSSKKPTSHAPEVPLYPDAISQHVRGTQTMASIPSIFPKRTTKPMQQDIDDHDYDFLKRSTLKSFPPSRIYRISTTLDSNVLADIPENHEVEHPAIAQMLTGNLQESFVSRRPWTDKWRPTCAQEVLGNEKSAIYLRNWLKALELQLENTSTASNVAEDIPTKNSKPPKRGLKRARVVRAVEKRRKRARIDSEDEEDDWIVRSDESEDDHGTYEMRMRDDDDPDDFFLNPPTSSPTSNLSPSINDTSPSTPQGTQTPDKPPDLGQLHNTILLAGPSGSGKTASVYACAEELGWDVFEVYPGIGRRNGSNVDNLVGEVGKNHLVLQNRQPGDVLKHLMLQKNKVEASNTADDLQPGYSPRKKAALNIAPDPEDATNSGVKPIRQSLILFEEVDILFKEDTNFWSTVLRVIKDCKRPVICTCNDISLVPIEELPLQNILYLESCPPDIATSYLQSLCAAEGHMVEREFVSSLYTDPIPEQQCSDIFSAEPLPLSQPDLRRAINALQIVCTTANSVEYTHPRSNLTEAIDAHGSPSLLQGKSLISLKRSESLSFLDGVLGLDALQNFMVTEFATYLPSEDDEMGHVILHDLYAQDTAQIGMYDRHKDILGTAFRLSQELFDVDVKVDAMKTQAFEEQSRIVHCEHDAVLREVCPLAIWARRDAGTALDYIPLIRQMVDEDDRQETEELGKKRGSGRNTRNSARSGYVRMIGITEEGRRQLAESGLGS